MVTLETAAGLVRAEASCRDGRCQRVTFTGVPSFVEALDVPLEVPGVGTVTVDVAYGGCFYVLVDAAALGVRLTRRGGPRRRRAGRAGDGGRPATAHGAPPGDPRDRLPLLRDGDRRRRSRGGTASGAPPSSAAGSTGHPAGPAPRPGSPAWPRVVWPVPVPRSSPARSSTASSRSSVSGTAAVGDRTAVLPVISGRDWIFGTRTTTRRSHRSRTRPGSSCPTCGATAGRRDGTAGQRFGSVSGRDRTPARSVDGRPSTTSSATARRRGGSQGQAVHAVAAGDDDVREAAGCDR